MFYRRKIVNAGPDFMNVKKIISGGQTGVDRAGLDFAIETGIEHGGYCPKGRRAEDGRIPAKYNLIETESADYEERTERNLTESDGTLIMYIGKMRGGTLLTSALCRKEGKPCLIIDLNHLTEGTARDFTKWLMDNGIRVLNIAGGRESVVPIYSKAMECLRFLFSNGKIRKK